MLYLFDLDGTLIEGYIGTKFSYERVKALPGRRAKLAELVAGGHQVGIVTNQGGVAHGYQSEAQFYAKYKRALKALNLDAATPVYVCFSIVGARVARYGLPTDYIRRKPEPTMILEAMAAHRVSENETVFIGDRPEDFTAAASARVTFVWSDVFFTKDKR